jgi:DNA-binding XRE family transcriptional regulator
MSQRHVRSAEFGAWVRRVRQSLGLTRQALASAAGLAPSTLRNVEMGRHCANATTAAALLAAIAARDKILAARAPLLWEESGDGVGPGSSNGHGVPPPPLTAEVYLQPRGDRWLLQVALDLAALGRLVGCARGPAPTDGPAGGLTLSLTLAVPDKKLPAP